MERKKQWKKRKIEAMEEEKDRS